MKASLAVAASKAAGQAGSAPGASAKHSASSEPTPGGAWSCRLGIGGTLAREDDEGETAAGIGRTSTEPGLDAKTKAMQLG